MRRRNVLTCTLVLTLGTMTLMVQPSTTAQPPPPPKPAPPPPAPPIGAPFATLTRAELARWNAGRALFGQPATPQVGLGPVFTENSCVTCHATPVIGGSGTRLVTHFGRTTNGVFDPLLEYGGPQLQNKGIGKFNGVNFVGEVVPPQANVVARHRTSPLFGLGLVDAVPDEVFLTIAHQQAASTPATAGVVSEVTDPSTGQVRVGKFGWKAQDATLFDFTGDAFANEMGVTTPLFPTENCPQGDCALLAANPARSNPNQLNNASLQAFTDFVAFTAPPPRGTVGATEQAGATLFASIGCASCHTPTLQTGPDVSASLNEVTFAPYSDFLLHNMGTLGDGIVQNQAGATMMRTAPLWGLRFETLFLHDGRATTPDQAIRDHAGQGLAAATRYAQLNATQRAQLIAFLNSL